MKTVEQLERATDAMQVLIESETEHSDTRTLACIIHNELIDVLVAMLEEGMDHEDADKALDKIMDLAEGLPEASEVRRMLRRLSDHVAYVVAHGIEHDK